jgi:hypothetical protein
VGVIVTSVIWLVKSQERFGEALTHMAGTATFNRDAPDALDNCPITLDASMRGAFYCSRQ